MQVLEQQFGRLTVDPADFIGRGIRSSLFSKTYLALKQRTAKDWWSGLALSLSHQGRNHFIQYHHIFPKFGLEDLRSMVYSKATFEELFNKKSAELIMRKNVVVDGKLFTAF